MIAGQFDVVFRGQIVKNFELEQVKDNLVQLFKSSPEAVDKLFSGKEVAIKKSLDYTTAMKYQSALKKAGALALIKEVESDPNTNSHSKRTDIPSPGDGAESRPKKAQFGPAAASFTDATPKPPSSVDREPPQASSNTGAEPAVATEEPANNASHTANQDEPVSDVSTQSASESQSEPTAEGESFTVAEVGASILPDKVYEKRDVDTSALSLAEPGERIMPDTPKNEPPAPSVEHLSLVDN